jgi:hypothetical protein
MIPNAAIRTVASQRLTALVIDVGRRILPTITPDDAEAVQRIFAEHAST